MAYYLSCGDLDVDLDLIIPPMGEFECLTGFYTRQANTRLIEDFALVGGSWVIRANMPPNTVFVWCQIMSVKFKLSNICELKILLIKCEECSCIKPDSH